MGADRTLVDAAFKVASTRASGDVLDMKPLYGASGSLSNNLFKVFNTSMQQFKAKKEVNRTGVRKQLEGFQADAEKLVSGMYAQDEPLHDAFIAAFRNKIIQLQDDFEDVNTYGKGDNEENKYARAKIMGELKRVENEANNFRNGTEAFFKSLIDVDPDTLSGRNIAAHRQALDFTNYDDLVKAGKIKIGYGKNGIEIYSKDYNTKTSGGFGALTPGADGSFARTIESTGEQVTVTLDSLQYNFKPTDKAHHAEIFADMNNAVKNAQVEALKPNAKNNYNEDEYDEIFTRHVNTKTKFRNAVSSKIEGIHEIKSSFKVSLENNLNIPIGVLSNMFLDANDDGVDDMPTILKELNIAGEKNEKGGYIIDAEDIAKGQGNAAFEQNLEALIDALTNVDNPAFDIELSSRMLGNYFGEINKNRYDQAFNKTTKENKPSGGENRSIVLGTYRDFKPQNSIIDLAEKGETINDWAGNEWNPDLENPGNYKHSSGETVEIEKLLKGPYFGLTERINDRGGFNSAQNNNGPTPLINNIAESDLTWNVFEGSASAAYDKLNALKYNGINYSTMTTSFMGINKKTEDNIKVFSGDNEIILDFSRDGEESARVQLEKLNAFIEQHRKK